MRLIPIWLVPIVLTVGLAPAIGRTGSAPVPAQSGGAAAIEQIDARRPSPTVQSSSVDRVPPLVAPAVLSACLKAQAADRPAPAGLDCVRALQVSAASAAARTEPTAEGSLLNMIGQDQNVTATTATNRGGAAVADEVARQLSSGDFQGAASGEAAGVVARDRPGPQPSAPPPR